MPQFHDQRQTDSLNDFHSEAPASETLFLLSICRDEDDAAALRSDLKRSALNDYKIQRCAELDDASHLLQVCGFDLAFLRLDDFSDRQAAVDLIRQRDPEIATIGLVSGRLLASADFEMPSGIDAHCRLEDLSPTLVANAINSVLERRKSRHDRLRLDQELSFAVEVGELGAWQLDVETGRLALGDKASFLLGFKAGIDSLFLDDLVEAIREEDRDRLKRLVDLSIETQGDLEANFRVRTSKGPSVRLEIKAKYRPGTPRSHPLLYGFIKRSEKSSDAIHASIASANEAIQNALKLRDEAIQTASRELELLYRKVRQLEGDGPPPPESADREQVPARSEHNSVEEEQAGYPAQAPSPSADSDEASSESLAIDKSTALKNVLKSITRTKKAQDENTFPFDFSAEQPPDYSEPNPLQDGFVGAAKRLVSITQNGHQLSVTLSIENDGAVEYEREKELLFEILRELLTNVVKHARASECIIALFRDEDEWVLQVEDDGVGLENNLVSISTPLNKIGLFRIRTKLALKGGQLDLTPTFPKGLIARARLPVSLSNRDAERA